MINVAQDHTEAMFTFHNLNPNSYEVRVIPVSVVGEESVEGTESPTGTFRVGEYMCGVGGYMYGVGGYMYGAVHVWCG